MSPSLRFSRSHALASGLAVSAAGIIGFLIGSRHPTVRAEAHRAPESAIVSQSSAATTRKSRSLPVVHPWEHTMNRLLFTPQEEVLPVAEGLRDLFRLSDSDLSQAWQSLSHRPPRSDYVGSLVAAYLWSRQAMIDSHTPLPEGWGLENFPGLAETFHCRNDLDAIRSALLNNEEVSPRERRLFYLESVRTEPLACFKLWIKTYQGESHLEEVQWFHQLMENPADRMAMLASLTHAPLGESEKEDLLAKLFSAWCGRDPAAALGWLEDPTTAPYREKLLIAYSDQQVRTNPQNAWALSEALAPEHRLSAQISAAGVLARDNPDLGIEKIAELPPGTHREKLMATFGESLAMFDYPRWNEWRNSLPPADQENVSQAAFESWLGADTSAALSWMESLPDGTTKSSLMKEFASQFASREPAAVAAWIRTLPKPDDRLAAVISGIRGIPEEQYHKIRMMLEALR